MRRILLVVTLAAVSAWTIMAAGPAALAQSQAPQTPAAPQSREPETRTPPEAGMAAPRAAAPEAPGASETPARPDAPGADQPSGQAAGAEAETDAAGGQDPLETLAAPGTDSPATPAPTGKPIGRVTALTGRATALGQAPQPQAPPVPEAPEMPTIEDLETGAQDSPEAPSDASSQTPGEPGGSDASPDADVDKPHPMAAAEPVSRKLAQGDPVYARDVLTTGEDSSLVVTFIDDTTLSLGATAELSLVEFGFAAEVAEDNHLLFSMGRGAFRLVTGQVAKKNPDRFKVTTPLGTIGIRGTGIASLVEAGYESHGLLHGGPFTQTLDTGEILEVAEVGRAVEATPEGGRVLDAFPERLDRAMAQMPDQEAEEPTARDSGDCKVLVEALAGDYDGACVEGLAHGQGTARGQDTYEGSFAKGLPHGTGVYTFADGRVYQGPFVNGAMHGKGVMKFPDGRVYEGDFDKGSRTGQGTLEHPDGAAYQGGFVDGRMHGQGTYVWEDGSIYKGEFASGARTGQGTLKMASGETYQGGFKNGAMHGTGTYWWPSGDVFRGTFIKNKMHGQGIFWWSKGGVYVQEYDEGKLVRQQKMEQ